MSPAALMIILGLLILWVVLGSFVSHLIFGDRWRESWDDFDYAFAALGWPVVVVGYLGFQVFRFIGWLSMVPSRLSARRYAVKLPQARVNK